MRFAVSVFNGASNCQISASFATFSEARNFVEWRIEDLLDAGAKYLVVCDVEARTERRYRADGVADCAFLGIDWRHARLDESVAEPQLSAA